MSDGTIRVLMLARAVFPIHGFGGIERHVFHLTTHLARQGVNVHLVAGHGRTADAQANRAELLAAAGLPAATDRPHLTTLRYDRTTPVLRPNSIVGRQINYPIFSLAEGRLAARLIRGGAVDVVHTQGLCAFGFACFRQVDPALRRVPFIANPHGLEEYRTEDWRKWLAYAPFRAMYSAAHRAADRVIATDGATQADLPRYLRVPRERVVVIPSAIDVDECLHAVDPSVTAELRDRWHLDDADLVMLSVGRIERNKGYHVLLDALVRLRHRLPPHWRWILVGQGHARPALQAAVAVSGLGEHIIFAGSLNDVELHSLYDGVDLFVHPTLYEGSSLVTLEAMLHQLPVVASAAGGIPDKVFPGHNGLLVAPGDVDQLSVAIASALDQRGAWPTWGERGKQIVETTFSWPAAAARTRAEYDLLLAAARPTTGA